MRVSRQVLEGEVGDGVLIIRRCCSGDVVSVGGNSPRKSDAEEGGGMPHQLKGRGILEGGIGDPSIKYNPPKERRKKRSPKLTGGLVKFDDRSNSLFSSPMHTPNGLS